ncbi:MAG: chorismate mutase [Candidatus Woesearchaeota archaeon]|jgi:chorismate mutase|nr:chorismate mutase [Candidatus Woesearchaeota archaeon]
MKDLSELRLRIDEIDKEISNLVVKRMDASKEIAKLKIENDLIVLDPNRENEIINNQYEYLKNLGIDDLNFINAFFGIIMIKSKQIQNELVLNN